MNSTTQQREEKEDLAHPVNNIGGGGGHPQANYTQNVKHILQKLRIRKLYLTL